MQRLKVFLSYSRQQLYFAETLSLQLQKRGLDVWFDLQQLQPGREWEAQIETALRECEALVLVASCKSLASPYVKKEWESAVSAGKPVHVVLYEAVELPWALQTAGHIDFRGAFKPALQKLAGCLQANRYCHDPLPRPNRWNVPSRLPPGIGFLFWSNLLWAVLAAPSISLTFPFFSPPLRTLYGLGVSAFLFWILWKFLHHKMAFAALGMSAMMPFILLFFKAFPNFGLYDDFWSVGWPVVASMLTFLILFALLSPALLRWSVPDDEENIQAARRLFNRPIRGRKTRADPSQLQDALSARGTRQPVRTAQPASPPPLQRTAGTPPREFTFSLSHAPADRPIATLVRRALRRQKFTEVEGSPAQIRLLVLTQNVTRLELQSFLEEDGHRVAILADNLDMHSDPLLEAVIRQQVVDFRDGSPAVLKALARTLGDPSTANLPLGFETTPKPLNALILPRGIRENAMLVRSAGAYLLFAGLGGLLLSVLGLPNTPLVGFVSVLLGLCLLNAGRRIWQRRILRLLFVPVYALSLWLHITIIFTTFFNSFAQPTPQDWTGWILTLERLASFEDWTCFLPFTLLSTLATTVPLYNSTMKNWLPALGQSRRKDGLFMLLRSPLPARWSRASWLIGAFYAFGMPILARLVILFFTEAFSL